MKYKTIQKVAEEMGVDCSYIRTMIKNKILTPHRIKGYKRVYIDIDELNTKIKPMNSLSFDINLDGFLI